MRRDKCRAPPSPCYSQALCGALLGQLGPQNSQLFVPPGPTARHVARGVAARAAGAEGEGSPSSSWWPLRTCPRASCRRCRRSAAGHPRACRSQPAAGAASYGSSITTPICPQSCAQVTFFDWAGIEAMVERGRQYNADPSRGGGEFEESRLPSGDGQERMGALLGSGSYAKVYLGECHGCSVGFCLPLLLQLLAHACRL